MKIAIMGAGGIGGFYGGLLARAGENVAFIARGTHLDAMRNNGLRVLSHFGDFDLPTVNATDDPAQVGPVELVVMAIKAYGLEAAARDPWEQERVWGHQLGVFLRLREAFF